ncbi:hypothetical protein [Campylobacter pinnipediorum]|uniref:hypothetical protein n=1 Tax=Campylobacter pinnipediorum TaxID=1965231 RepID=UPI000995A78A|nr:hypothetical protein [Campylobacter pinnipediorum]AQW80666.1 putative membrane protein [Campylobacter pinnipediorum subsp. pinnipediorum]AQW82334.1 putative membrane protein [Campylobacter pinnipediorum subsp. pinnipediorum]
MQPENIAFARLGQFLPFFHIASVILFIGMQIGFWYVLKFFLKEESSKETYSNTLNALKIFWYMILIGLFLIVVTGSCVQVTDAMKSADPMANAILGTKYTLFGFLTLNVFYMFYCYQKSKNAFLVDEMIECYENIIVIIKYFIPLNIIISLVATYLGVAYRGF